MDVTQAELVAPSWRRSLRKAMPLPLALLVIPVAFALLGLCLRYAAYASVAPDATLAGFPAGLCKWDCQWYVRLAEQGYDRFPVPSMINAGNWAFFPLMPMLVGALRMASGLPTMVVATAVSIVLSYLTALAAWPLLQHNLRAYTLFSAYLLSGPFSIYFTTFFTEAPFILLIVCVFVALQRSNYLAAGGFAALLSATRIVGVFIALAILLQALLEHRRGGGTLRGFVPATIRRPDIVLGLVLAPLGLFAYMAFLHLWVGDALAFSHVQRAWGRAPGNALGFLWSALSRGPESGWWLSQSQLLGIAVLAGVGLTGVLAWRRQYAAALFCAVCILLPMSAGMASMLRFVAALAPLAIVAMLLLARWRPLFLAALAGLCAADYFVTVAWLSRSLALV